VVFYQQIIYQTLLVQTCRLLL